MRRRFLRLVCAAASMMAVAYGHAAPTDCMGTAPDGLAQCTAPRVPPHFSYGVCIANNLSTTEAAQDYCGAQVGPLDSDPKIIQYVNCVGERLGGNQRMSSINWKPEGATDSSASWLCGTYQVVWKYGMELRGFDRQDLYYSVFPNRYRAAECPRGYSPVYGTDNQIDYCVKTAACPCDTVGNPMGIADAEKKVFETDYAEMSSSPLRFRRSYSHIGFYRPVAMATPALAGFGDFWRHTYDRRVYAEGSLYLMASAIRETGIVKHFRSDGKEVLNQDGGRDTLVAQRDAAGTLTGWVYRSAAGEVETYDAAGRLLTIVDARGRKQTMTYSDALTPATVAPVPGLLIKVTDDFGRALSFTYDDKSRLRTMTDPDGGVYTYSFDGNELLTQVQFPAGTSRRYTYNESPTFASSGGPYAISGIFDENGNRFATYSYRSDYWNTPDVTEHAGGAQKYSRYPVSSNVVTIIDPLGTQRNYTTQVVNGVLKIIDQTQPGGSGSASATTQLGYDAQGNVSTRVNFIGQRSCHAYVPGRNLESVRIEGLNSADACPADLGSYAVPAGATAQRKITTAWHPSWSFEVRRAEAKKITTWVYHGQPDPTAGNAIASCVPSGALVDGEPLAVPCKKVEQATADETGSSGFNAGAVGAARVWSYTYNAVGQVLTATDPRGNATTYVYYTDTTADHTQGDLSSATNALGHVRSTPGTTSAARSCRPSTQTARPPSSSTTRAAGR